MVKAWKERVVIPTYEVGKPEKNPIFLEKCVFLISEIESIMNRKF